MTTLKTLRFTALLTLVVLFTQCKKGGSGGGSNPPPEPPAATFLNPIFQGSDPWVAQKDGNYYYSHTLGNRVAIWKTNKMSRLASGTITTIITPAAGAPNQHNVWAPELHFLNGKWYCYYTAGSGPDATQRMWVAENDNADPTQGTWVDKGKIFAAGSDFWSIDGSILEYNGSLYYLWSGRPDGSVQNQNIYIARMTNPWTLEGTPVMLTKPELSWETVGGPVNEGPQILKNSAGNVFMIYSASGCWTDDYALGMLTLTPGSDPLVLSNWTKKNQPVFAKQPNNFAFGPGHNGFFKSPDGTEDWIIYHANSASGDGCSTRRNIRMQKFTWNADGSPNFGTPVKTSTPLPLPKGE